MQQSISSVKSELVEAANAVIDYSNALRQIQWDMFDRGVDAISNLVDESQFLIDVMSHEDLVDEGQYTSAGLATQGLLVQNYQSYVDQAKAYGEEAESIKELLEEDPKNTTLIDRYNELKAAQREAILNTYEEEEAIKDLTENYYDSLIDKIKELIDEYTDALDSAKDLYDYILYSPLHIFMQCIPLNCWEALKIFKPQHKDEICLNVMVIKIGYITDIQYG